MNSITTQRKEMNLRRLWIITTCLLLTSTTGATPFRGTISGQVTGLVDDWRASGVTLPEFGINSPLFVGDAITGFYSYNSPTRDVNVWFDVASIDLNITLIFAGQALELDWACYHFETVGGAPSFFVGDVSSYDSTNLALSASKNSFHLEEIHTLVDEERDRQVWGSLTCGPSSVVKVPELGATGLLTFVALGVLWVFSGCPRLGYRGKRVC